MQKKSVRVALEAVAVIVIVGLGRSVGGTIGDVLMALGVLLLIYAIYDLLK